MSMWRLCRKALAVFFLCLAPCALCLAQSLATYEGPGREQKLAEAARKEGTLLWYTTTPVEYAKQLAEPFEKRYGIKVEIWRARSELILQRVLTEARSGKPT